ncbi:MAG: hypothetical protein HQL23_02160 [Candidatus Omnitrophica bacterium]|nr:hypothetical protein [Candidatus Omnitrophota bacterium]
MKKIIKNLLLIGFVAGCLLVGWGQMFLSFKNIAYSGYVSNNTYYVSLYH